MSSNQGQSVGQVYAVALFELALEQDQSESVGTELNHLSKLIEANPEFDGFLKSPAISQEQKKKFFQRVFTGKLSEMVMDFLMVLTDKDRLGQLRAIQSFYSDLEDRRAGRVWGELTTAVAVSDKQTAAIEKRIGKTLGKKLSLTRKVDESIIGGMVLTIGGQVINATVREDLKRFLKRCRERAQEQIN